MSILAFILFLFLGLILHICGGKMVIIKSSIAVKKLVCGYIICCLMFLCFVGCNPILIGGGLWAYSRFLKAPVENSKVVKDDPFADNHD